MRLIFIIAFLSLFTFANNSFAYDTAIAKEGTVSLKSLEDSIQSLGYQLYNARRNDKKSKELSSQITSMLKKALAHPDANKYAFDSVFPITKISSPKGNVKIFTWNVVHYNGTHTHYGVIHYQNKDINKTIELSDKTNEIEDLTSAVLNNEKWYGAIYYDIVEEKNSAGTHYILLGWHGNNLMSNKKVVETMYFTESGKVKFGKSLLKASKKKYKRIIFEYSRMADMMLRYDENLEMIVLDHLSPIDPLQAGNYQFYGPDLSYDAFKYNGEFWEYKETIDYKRPKEKKKKRK